MKKRMTEEAKAALKEAKVEWKGMLKKFPEGSEYDAMRKKIAKEYTGYKGVWYREVDGIKSYYVRGRVKSTGEEFFEPAERPGHRAKTASEANAIRSKLIAGTIPPNKVRREKQEEAKKAESSRWTFDKLWDSWKEHNANKAGLSRDDSRYTKHLKDPFGDREPSALQPLDIDRLKKQLFADDYAPDSIVSTISLLKRIANFGLDKQLCAGLTFRIKLNDKKLRRRNRTECLTPEQTESYRKICREYPNKQVGNLCLLVEQSGIRHSNAVNLKWSDVDFENGFIHLAETKSGEPKILPLSDVALSILRDHWDHHRIEVSEFVFSGRDKHVPGKLSTREVRDGVGEIRDLADLPLFDGKKFRPLHGLRHSLGSRLVNDGTSLFIVQNVLGHATPSVTARYSHLANSTLRDALNASNKPKSETA